MSVRLRFAAVVLAAGLAGCAPPPGSFCVDGRVWVPQPGTSVAIPVVDGAGIHMRCVPAPKETR